MVREYKGNIYKFTLLEKGKKMETPKVMTLLESLKATLELYKGTDHLGIIRYLEEEIAKLETPTN